MEMETDTVDFLYLIDLQNDFISGKLKALGAEDKKYIESICTEIDATKEGDPNTYKYSMIYVTHDWHPPYHCSFNAFPQHCVQDTDGADIRDTIFEKLKSFNMSIQGKVEHPILYEKRVSNETGPVVNLYKGFDQTCDTYAAARTPANGRPQEYAPDKDEAEEASDNFAWLNYKRFYDENQNIINPTKNPTNVPLEIKINGHTIKLKHTPELPTFDTTSKYPPYRIATCKRGTNMNTGSALRNEKQNLTQMNSSVREGNEIIKTTQFKIEEQSPTPTSITILGLCTDFCAANTALNMMANFKGPNSMTLTPTSIISTKIIFRSDLSRPIGFPNKMTDDDKNTKPILPIFYTDETNNFQEEEIKLQIQKHSCNARMLVYYMMMHLMGIQVKSDNSEDTLFTFTFNETKKNMLNVNNCYFLSNVKEHKFEIMDFSIDITKPQFYCLEYNDRKPYSLLEIFDHEGGFKLNEAHIDDKTNLSANATPITRKSLWDNLNALKPPKPQKGSGKRKMNNKKHNHVHNRPPSNFFLLPGSTKSTKTRRQKQTTKSKTTTSKKTSSGIGDYEKMGVSTFMHKSKKKTQMLYKKKKNGKTYFRMKDDKTGVMKYVLLK